MGLLATCDTRPLASQKALSLVSFTQTCPRVSLPSPWPSCSGWLGFLLSQRDLVQSCGLPKSLKITGKSRNYNAGSDFCTELQTSIATVYLTSAGCLMITVTTAKQSHRLALVFGHARFVPTLEPSGLPSPLPRHCVHLSLHSWLCIRWGLHSASLSQQPSLTTPSKGVPKPHPVLSPCSQCLI